MRATDPVGEDDLQAFVDGRLSQECAEAVEAYLAEHPAERERYSQYVDQREELRAAFSEQTAATIPARLRVQELLAARRRHNRQRLARTAAAVGFLVLGALGGWTARDVLPRLTSSGSAMLASAVFDDAIAAHRTFSVEMRHPVEVGANEEAHLVQWLSKRLGHRLIAPDLADLGFRLMGGRLLPADNGPAALFMYENSKGIRVSCYFLSAEGSDETEFKYRDQDGVGAFYWVADGLAYAIAANAPRDLLLKIAEIIYQQNSPDGSKPKLPPAPGKPS